ncbi:MAG: hypothetical protein ACOY4Q_12805, partial [Bacillota bacterium]
LLYQLPKTERCSSFFAKNFTDFSAFQPLCSLVFGFLLTGYKFIISWFFQKYRQKKKVKNFFVGEKDFVKMRRIYKMG